jgi:hypothetical protein
MGLFTRRRTPAAISGLGQTLIALRLGQGDATPAASTVVIFNPAGHARRVAAGRVACNEGEIAWCFHPGPYSVDLLPFAAAPEIGLRLRFVIDAADPRVIQQRFDLYLFSEVEAQLALDDMRAGIETALQTALAQGSLDLPPCTSLDEWNVFRAGLNQLLYTRFGITVDDCVPVDLGDTVDYAAVLRARVANAVKETPLPADVPAAGARTEPQLGDAGEGHHAAAAGSAATAAPAAPAAEAAVHAAANAAAADVDARAVRRLFLELPALSGALRMLVLPPGLETFQTHQALLQRLGLAALSVGTMPSLAWAAPDQPLPAPQQQRRSAHGLAAVGAMDEAWSLLARLQLASAPQWPQLLDEADRICANLEFHLELRRAPFAAEQRKEPSL